MAIIRPTLSEILNAIRSDGDALLGGVDARLERGLSDVLLTAQAGALHGAYGFLQNVANNAFPDTAEGDALERWAGIFGKTRSTATFAIGWVGASGTPPTETIPVGTLLRRSDGREFKRVAVGDYNGAAVGSGNTTTIAWSAIGLSGTGWVIPVQAVASGTGGNTTAGTTISFVSPISGVPTSPTVRIGISGAVDEETDTSLRKRVVDRIQAPPQGGTAADYKSWALDASTVSDPITRAWVVSPTSGGNSVTVYVVNDGGGFPSANPPTPSSQAITNVENAIDLYRPLCSARSVSAPTFAAMNLSITLSPSSTEIQTAIENELDAYLIDNAAPGLTIPISVIRAVVQNAAGSSSALVTSPVSNFVPGATAIFHRGTITWA